MKCCEYGPSCLEVRVYIGNQTIVYIFKELCSNPYVSRQYAEQAYIYLLLSLSRCQQHWLGSNLRLYHYAKAAGKNTAKYFNQETLTEGDGSLQFTSMYRQLISVAFDTQNIINFFTKQATLMRVGQLY